MALITTHKTKYIYCMSKNMINNIISDVNNVKYINIRLPKTTRRTNTHGC